MYSFVTFVHALCLLAIYASHYRFLELKSHRYWVRNIIHKSILVRWKTHWHNMNPTTHSPKSCPSQDCQVGLFEAKINQFRLFLIVGLEIFENLLSRWPFFKSIEVYIVKSKNFLLIKQSLAFFSYKTTWQPWSRCIHITRYMWCLNYACP